MAPTNLPAPIEPPFDDDLVDGVLAEPESHDLEFKRLGADKPTRTLESIDAFANSDGGIIGLGLEDPDKATGRARVYGIDENPMKWDELRRLIRSRITEPDLLPCQPMEVGCTLRDGSRGAVVFLRVGRSSRIHSIIDGGTYERLGKSNRQLSATEINELSFARGTITAESQCEPVDFDLLDSPYWRGYARQRHLSRPIDQAMRHVGLAKPDAVGRLRPTRAAVLLFAEEPSGLLAGKAAIRVFHYQGKKIESDPDTNLVRPPITVGGPVIQQIRDASNLVVGELASGVQMSPLGFEVIQAYPIRVLKEAITNAVIHRDYHIAADIHIRIFANRVEVESPGLFIGPVTSANIHEAGTHGRNPVLVSNLREFPDPPNLDAGEGVRMMFGLMRESGLYTPVYASRPQIMRNAVVVTLYNEHRPSTWDSINKYIDEHGTIGNAEVRQEMGTDVLTASKQIRKWIDRGLLIVTNPDAGTKVRRYGKPGFRPKLDLFSIPKR